MNDRDKRANTEKIMALVKKLSVIIAFGLLTLTSYASDVNVVRDVQLMLSLKGYNLSYRDSKGVDGKLGLVTREAIIDYQKKKTLPLTGTINKGLYDSLYEDTKSKLPLPPDGVEEKKDKAPKEQKPDNNKTINTLAGELNTIRDDLQDTNAELKAVRNNISANFTSSYTGLVSIIVAGFSIFVAVLLGLILPKFQKKITNDVKKAHKKMLEHSANHISAGLLTEFSGHCLTLYKDFDEAVTLTPKQKTLHDSYLEIAKNVSDRGYGKAKKLAKSNELTEIDNRIIAYSINNKLFYTVTPFISDDKKAKNVNLDNQEVRKVFDEMKKIYSTYDENYMEKEWWNFKETLIWTRFNMNYYTDLSKIKNDVQTLISDRNLPYEWRLEIFNRYKKHTTTSGAILKDVSAP